MSCHRSLHRAIAASLLAVFLGVACTGPLQSGVASAPVPQAANATQAEHAKVESARRRLQFEDLFGTPQSQKMRRKKAREAALLKSEGGAGAGGSGGSMAGIAGMSGAGGRRSGRQQAALGKAVEDILLNLDRYHLWWTGPPESDSFKPAGWAAMHTETSNAVFTMAFVQGQADYVHCSSPNDFRLFLGSLRRVYSGDVVVAVEAGLPEETKAILTQHRAVVYEIPHNLCAKQTKSIFCGSQDERVPASVFRYFFYEKVKVTP